MEFKRDLNLAYHALPPTDAHNWLDKGAVRLFIDCRILTRTLGAVNLVFRSNYEAAVVTPCPNRGMVCAECFGMKRS